VFPVKYELDSYILFRRNSAIKELIDQRHCEKRGCHLRMFCAEHVGTDVQPQMTSVPPLNCDWPCSLCCSELIVLE
jgi:hypothetical protein